MLSLGEFVTQLRITDTVPPHVLLTKTAVSSSLPISLPSWSPKSSTICKYSMTNMAPPPRCHRRPSTTPSLFPQSLESQPSLFNTQFCEKGVTVPILQMGEARLGSKGQQMVNSRAEITATKHLHSVYAKVVRAQIQTHPAPHRTRM